MKKRLVKRIVALVAAVVMALPVTVMAGTKPSELKGLSKQEVVDKVGPLFQADYQSSDVLASVSMAQFLLETGYGQSELFQNANNGFGMRAELSDMTWSGSKWDGKSTYLKRDWQPGMDIRKMFTKYKFRKYSSFEDSIADHSAYLAGTKKGKNLRYDVKGETDYKKAAHKIASGGYSANPDSYEKNLINIIEKYNLTKYDVKETKKSESKAKYTAGEYIIKSSTLNVRSKSNANSKILKTYKTGNHVTIDRVEGKWGHVKKDNGWVNLGYCEKAAEPATKSAEYTVVGESLNIRSEATVNSKKLGELPVGYTFTVIKFNGKWGYINEKGKCGWVNTGYAKKK